MYLTPEAPTPFTYLRLTLLPLLTVLALGSTAAVASGRSDPELQGLRKQLQEIQSALQQLSEENRGLRTHQQEIDRRLAELARTVSAGTPDAAAALASAGSPAPNAAALPNAPPVPNASALPAASASPANGSLSDTLGNGLRLWGYGEVYYTHPTRQPQESQFDLARAVFGIGYRFDERTEFNSEYEV